MIYNDIQYHYSIYGQIITMQKFYQNFSTKNFQNYILSILELHANFNEILKWFTIFLLNIALAQKISIRLPHLKQLLTPNQKPYIS